MNDTLEKIYGEFIREEFGKNPQLSEAIMSGLEVLHGPDSQKPYTEQVRSINGSKIEGTIYVEEADQYGMFVIIENGTEGLHENVRNRLRQVSVCYTPHHAGWKPEVTGSEKMDVPIDADPAEIVSRYKEIYINRASRVRVEDHATRSLLNDLGL